MTLLTLGLLLGLVTVAAPGPISVAIVQVGSKGGPTAGVKAGMGVVGADVLTGLAAIALVTTGAAIGASTFEVLDRLAAAVLACMGAALVLRPAELGRLAGELKRPARAMFALTSFNPATLVSWIALIVAAPVSPDSALTDRLALACGVVLVSLAWHASLGALAGRLGQRLSPQAHIRMGRASGAVLVFVALGLSIW